MDLIERIEAATGPSRELDAEIAKAVGADHGPRTFVNIESRSYDEHAEIARHYTASVDAALTLVPEDWWTTLDRYSISDEPGPDPYAWRVWLKHLAGDLDNDDAPVYHIEVFGRSATPALALCIAALKARAAALRARGGSE